jgi:hypothetical protein
MREWKEITELDKEIIRNQRTAYEKMVRLVSMIFIFLALLLAYAFYGPMEMADSESISDRTSRKEAKVDEERVENGIHLATGLVFDENFDIVRANCTPCHSAKLISQNRMSRDAWDKTIKWMQETQKLWDLGPNNEKILDYLEKNYAPVKTGRRKNLVIEEWYWIE